MTTVFSVASVLWFFILPPFLLFLFKILWEDHVQGKFASKITWVLLEIIPPRDIEKSPQPMESIFSGLSGVLKSPNTSEQWIIGELPVSFSLEIASTNGTTHMYVRTQTGFRNLVEAHFYAQYPGVEIVEVPDYVKNIPKTIPNKDWDIWGADFGLVKEDLYPIKTYKFFEETVTGTMIDPLAGLFETMGTAGPGQHLWLQYTITPVKEDWYKTGRGTIDTFLGKVKEKKMGILMRLFMDFIDVFANIGRGLTGGETTFSTGAKAEKKDEAPVEFRLTPGEKDVLKALENNLGKQMFKVRMRYVYIGRRGIFNKMTGVSAFVGGLKQFSDQNLNGFKPLNNTKTDAKYLFVQKRLRFYQRQILRRYINRDTDPQHTRFLLSSEELATVFHIPDMSVTAPALTRVTAKRGSAPANLPIQNL